MKTKKDLANFKAAVGIQGVQSGMNESYKKMKEFSENKISINLAASARNQTLQDLKERAENLRFEAELIDSYLLALECFYEDYSKSMDSTETLKETL